MIYGVLISHGMGNSVTAVPLKFTQIAWRAALCRAERAVR